MTTTRRLSGWRRVTQLGFPIIAAIATFIACGSDRPDAAGDGINSGGGPFCGTPNAGCDCSTPGEVVDCGSVEMKSGDYVACSIGKRTCLGGKWGECQGTSIVTKNIATAVAGDLRGLTLGGSTMCPPPPSTQSNPCDPYCNQFVDDPTGYAPHEPALSTSAAA